MLTMTDPKTPKPKTAKDGTARGRPSDYNKKYIDEVEKYLKENEDEYQSHLVRRKAVLLDAEEDEIRERDMSTKVEHKFVVKLPTRDGFARYIGKPRQTVDNWSKEHSDFFDALEGIDIEQKQRLINCGLSGDYNSNIAKLVLSANHNMREKSDVTSDDKKIGSAADLIAAIEAKRDK